MTDPSDTTITTTSSSLFICFTTRHSSSSSMNKLSSNSKSIPSPGHHASTPTSLPTSLSRRLKSKSGHQSPAMFPSAGPKRRGFDNNPEPSSPKVTCIGQVRVKSKKQTNKINRTLSRSRRRNTNHHFALSSGANNSNNQLQQQQEGPDHHRNQRWVHLRCLFPCRPPSCLRRGRERESGRNRKGSCGDVVLVSLNNEGGQCHSQEVEEVSDYSGARASFCAARLFGEDVEERGEVRERISLRRHADEEEEEEEIEMYGGERFEGRGGGGRLSVSVPPKNALLLMRSRSDPVRVSALASRFWELSPAATADKSEEEREDCDECEEDDNEVGEESGIALLMGEKVEENEKLDSIEGCKEEEVEKIEPDHVGTKVEGGQREENPYEKTVEPNEETLQGAGDEESQEADEANQEALADPKSLEAENALLIQGGQEFTLVEERRGVDCGLSQQQEEEEEERTEEATLDEEEREVENADEEMEEETHDSPLELGAEELRKQTVTQETQERKDGALIISAEEREEKKELEERKATPLLPDCLLLMRYEPKLSMEVSKETWVCTTDFIRWLPERPRQKPPTDGGDETKKKKKRVGSTDAHPAPAPGLYQPPRSSCTLPAAVAGAGRVSVVSAAVGYEPPLGLTRCKSEPNRTAAAKLKPESCFWRNRRLEPHSRAAAVGVGAAGIGF